MDRPVSPNTGVRNWLVVLYLMVLGMVALGGITRLTGSGLSMVDWRPIMGVLPPMGEAEWLEVFERYRASPQGRLVNAEMTLEQFRTIFFWEYVHRVFGRLIGVAFAVPFVYFVARRRMDRPTTIRTGIAFLLGGAQGLLGWYMVRSGLVDVPRVSHFRLAAHLLLAFGTAQWILWIVLGLEDARSGQRAPGASGSFRRLATALALLVTAQILYGAFMAGTHAGAVSATFPGMNGSFSPGPFFTAETLSENFLYHPPAIHYVHRVIGWTILGVSALLFYLARKRPEPTPVRRATLGVVGAVTCQFALGVLTVVTQVPIWLAVTHQIGAFLTLSAVTVLVFRATRSPEAR